jgi:hypothetical protein
MAAYWLFAVLAVLEGSNLYALQFQVGALSGTMTQPTSNYHLLVYGGSCLLTTDDEKLSLQMGYVQRPDFSDAGFLEREYGSYVLFGGKLTKAQNKKYGIWAGVGGGHFKGTIAPKKQSEYYGLLPERGYAIDGMMTGIDWFLKVGMMRLSLGYYLLVGFSDHHQTEAYVAWPFHFMLVKLDFLI